MSVRDYAVVASIAHEVRAVARLSRTFFFFFNDTATTEIYTLSLHDALPIFARARHADLRPGPVRSVRGQPHQDRKSTRLNSSHDQISYAVFCLKKKNQRHSRIARGRSLITVER